MEMEDQFKYLFTPIKIGNLTIKNRFVCYAHATAFPLKDGLITDRHIQYWEEKAKGGWGLIIPEGNTVHPTSNSFLNLPRGYNPEAIPAFKKLSDAAHKYQDVKIFAQLAHTGRQTTSMFSEKPLWAPSPIPCPVIRETPHELEVEEIKEIVDAYANTALNLKKAGMDGVEIHSAHFGYIIAQFLCPNENERTDEYGGSLENRMRFLYEVIEAVRGKVGKDYVVGFRISGDHFEDGGLTLDDTKEIVKRVEETGKIDYIGLSIGTYSSIETCIPDMRFPVGSFIYFAAGLKEVLKRIPVIAIGRITDPVLAEKVLAENQADLIGMARAAICDPELPNKAKEGRLEDIRTCVGCMQGCLQRMFSQAPITCIQNPACGKEKELGIGTQKIASKKKKVIIVGGGPAGLKAAEVAARRGHEVILYEKKSDLGGQINIAALVPSRREFGDIARYLINQVQKLGVNINLNKEATVEMIMNENPDAVIVATGAEPFISTSIPGSKWENVVSVWDVLKGKKEVGKKVILVDGGKSHWECCGTAEFLVDQGKDIEIITPVPFPGMGICFTSLPQFYKKVLGGKAIFSPNEMIKEISESTVTSFNIYSGIERKIEGVDTIVLALGKKAKNQLYKSLKGKIKELYHIGDCYAPRLVDSAIREGDYVGRLL